MRLFPSTFSMINYKWWCICSMLHWILLSPCLFLIYFCLYVCCVFRPANCCSVCRSLVEIICFWVKTNSFIFFRHYRKKERKLLVRHFPQESASCWESTSFWVSTSEKNIFGQIHTLMIVVALIFIIFSIFSQIHPYFVMFKN